MLSYKKPFIFLKNIDLFPHLSLCKFEEINNVHTVHLEFKMHNKYFCLKWLDYNLRKSKNKNMH